ncbi:MAG: hypothetical protein WD733_21360 [Bryobacterales bacterium]
MRSKQIPSSDTFLVRVSAGHEESAAKRLAALGTIQDAGDAGVVVQLNGSGASDPKSVWAELQKQVDDAEVDPILLDETGVPHFPTGEVTVRFKHAPSDEFLSGFADKHGLKVRSRNEFVPAQVAFQVTTRGYLPDLVESLRPAENVASAWANTKSYYRRS